MKTVVIITELLRKVKDFKQRLLSVKCCLY